MTRREIIEEAKWAVIHHGPSNVFEFGPEIISDPAVLAEARKQAARVYVFFGYDSPLPE